MTLTKLKPPAAPAALALLSAALLGQPAAALAAEARSDESQPQRRPGEKVDVRVYADESEYASFPQLVRTDRELVLLFQVQDLERLREAGVHPHYQKVAELRWAVSRDGGLRWETAASSPKLGHVHDVSYGSAPLSGGGTVTLSFSSDEPLRAVLQEDRLVYRPYQTDKIETGEVRPIEDLGPFSRFAPHGMVRRSDGAIIAGGYVPFTPPGGPREKSTVAFLASRDEGRTWRYLSHVPNENAFDFSEPALIETNDGRLLSLLRADWDLVPADERPVEARTGYGYFLFQAESRDGGRTWSEPRRLSLWGHPPHLTRLASGNILLVYGHRREPYEIRAVLSRDEGRTWDETTVRTVHRFDPGGIDFGYPVATQLGDGTIVCAYYGYSTRNIAGDSPRGIFVSVFDEQWLANGRDQ